jgi:hypothetical protein
MGKGEMINVNNILEIVKSFPFNQESWQELLNEIFNIQKLRNIVIYERYIVVYRIMISLLISK